MEEIIHAEGGLEEKIERIDEESRSILAMDGVGLDMLEKLKEIFSKIPEFLNIGDKKKKEL